MKSLPQEILGELLAHCAEYAPALRAVCYAWRDIVGGGLASGRKTARRGLTFLAGEGHAALIAWTKEQREIPRGLQRDFMQPQLNVMLWAACRHGRSGLAQELYEQGAECHAEALWAAASGGHLDLVIWLKSRLIPQSAARTALPEAIFQAAHGNHGQVVEQLWSAWDYTTPHGYSMKNNKALIGAARGGHLALMRQAKARGGHDFHTALASAAYTGQVGAMKALHVWLKAADPHGEALEPTLRAALRVGMDAGHVHVVRLVQSWLPAGSFDNMFTLGNVTSGGCLELIHEAKKRGASDHTAMLTAAAGAGREDLCRLARSWGARVDLEFGIQCRAATRRGNVSLLELLLEWAEEDGHMFLDTELNYALESAVLRGHLAAARVLAKHGACFAETYYNGLFSHTALNDLDLMSQLLEWLDGPHICDHLGQLMAEGSAVGEERAMELLRSWSVKRLPQAVLQQMYDRAYRSAAYAGQLGAIALARSWGAKVTFNIEKALKSALNTGCTPRAEVYLREWASREGTTRSLAEAAPKHLEASTV